MSDTFLCDVCNKTYKTDKTFQQHKAKMHSNVVNTTEAPAKTTMVKSAPAKSAPAKSAPAKSAPVKSAPAKSASAKSASAKSTPAQKQPVKQTGGRASNTSSTPSASAQQQQQQPQTQNDNGPTRHYIITGRSRKNAEDIAASSPPVRPPETLESLREDIDELRMLVYALVRTHYIQTLTSNSTVEESSESDECGEEACTCE
jgi:hypothetical protein